MKTVKTLFRILALTTVFCVGAIVQAQSVESVPADAENGDAKAQNNYGELLNSENNPAEAVKWFRKAAEQNYSPAQYNLARCYELGTGVTKDMEEAYKWTLLATALADENTRQIYLSKFGEQLSYPQITKVREDVQSFLKEFRARADLLAKEARAKAEAQAIAEAQAKAEVQARADAQAKADAQVRAAQAQAEMQAKAEAQAKLTKTIKTAGFLLVSLVASIFIFKRTKKTTDATRSKKVSELSSKISLLKGEMDRKSAEFENWSKQKPETWKLIKTNLVDSYLASEWGEKLLRHDMFQQFMFIRLKTAAKEQLFLPPSARPTDEQWQSVFKSKVEPEAELATQRQLKIRGILLSRLMPNYDTKQCDIVGFDEKFIELDLENPDPTEPMSDKAIHEMIASLTEEMKAYESWPADKDLTALKKVSSDMLDYLRSSIATGSPVIPFVLREYQLERLVHIQAKNANLQAEIAATEKQHLEI